MPEFLGDGQGIQTQDDYARVATLGPSVMVERIVFSVLPPPGALVTDPVPSVFCQFAVYPNGPDGLPDPRQNPTWEKGFERIVFGNTVSAQAINVAGVRFRSQTAGKPATVYAEAVFFNDPAVATTILPAPISSSGTVTPPVTAIAVPHADCMILGNAPQTIPDGSPTVVVLSQADIDTIGLTFLPDGTVVFPSDGDYLCSAQGSWDAGAGSFRSLIFSPVSSFQGHSPWSFMPPVLGGIQETIQGTASQLLRLLAGDTVQLLAFQDSGGDLDISFVGVSILKVS